MRSAKMPAAKRRKDCAAKGILRALWASSQLPNLVFGKGLDSIRRITMTPIMASPLSIRTARIVRWVPSGMWLEFARRDLQRLEGI